MNYIINLCFLLSLCLSPVVLANMACGDPFSNHFGPWDYRTATAHNLWTVESVHFTAPVEALERGNSTTQPGPDISYTLNVFPNHHRALMAMTKLAVRGRTNLPEGSRRSMECWFDRAERFARDDASVRVIHGMYLARSGKSALALKKLDEASALQPSDANVLYNLGLLYLDLGQPAKALESAHRAYAAGFPLPGLRTRLQRGGHWREP